MALHIRERSPLLGELIAEGLTGSGIEAIKGTTRILSSFNERRKKEQEEVRKKKEKEEQIRQGEIAAKQFGLPPELVRFAIDNPKVGKLLTDQYIANRTADQAAQAEQKKSQEKEQGILLKQQAQEAGIQQEAQRAYDGIEDLYQTYNLTSGKDAYVPDWAKSQQAIIYKDKVKALRENPIIKKLGIVLPSLEGGSPEAFEDAFKKLSTVLIPQEQPQQQPGLPQEMRRPQEEGRPQEQEQNRNSQGVPEHLRRDIENNAQKEGFFENLPQLPGKVANSLVSGALGSAKNVAGVAHGLSQIGEYASRGLFGETGPEAQKKKYLEELSNAKNLPEGFLEQEKSRPVPKSGFQTAYENLPSRKYVAGILPYGNPSGKEGSVEKAVLEAGGDIGDQVAQHVIGSKLLGVATPAIGTLLKNAGITSGLGNTTKLLTKTLGGSKRTQEGVKFLTMVAASMKLGQSVEDFAQGSYGENLEMLPSNIPIPAGNTMNHVERAYNHFSKLGSGLGSKADVVEKIKPHKILNAGISYKDAEKYLGKNATPEAIEKLMNAKTNLAGTVPGAKAIKGVSYKDAMEFISEVQKIPNLPDASQNILDDFREVVKSSLKSNKSLPKEAIDKLIEADTLWAAAKRSEAAGKFIEKLPRVASYAAKAGNSGLLLLALAGSKTSAALGALGLAGSKGLQAYTVLKSAIQHPPVLKAYIQIMDQALKKNATGVIRGAAKLAKAGQEVEKKKK